MPTLASTPADPTTSHDPTAPTPSGVAPTTGATPTPSTPTASAVSVGCHPIARFASDPHLQRPQVATPEDADGLLRPRLAGLDREHCLLVSLDARHRVIAIDTVSVGSVDHTFMAPREVYRDALLRGAAAIMLAHNHPSGDPSPSPADRAVSRRLAAAGATLGVALVDHLIIGDSGFVSLAREGCL
ncbi:MAG TPA: JAB domain-containing protein [Euzebya sp.]|nr:JAB domain-containing protein [Euzebya sp.]